MTSKYDHLNLKLGRISHDAGLDPIPRKLGRQGSTPFFGHDLWNLWEAGYVQANGIKRSLVVQIAYSCHSPFIVESKSLKLFLNHIGQEVFGDDDSYLERLTTELEHCVKDSVELRVVTSQAPMSRITVQGLLLDEEVDQVVRLDRPKANILEWQPDSGEECYVTHGFQSNCPVTGQPDFACVVLKLCGPSKPTPQSLLTYLSSFSLVQEFHEGCCERIYLDLLHSGQPDSVTVACHFTRRGGIDINPVRSSFKIEPQWASAFWRQ